MECNQQVLCHPSDLQGTEFDVVATKEAQNTLSTNLAVTGAVMVYRRLTCETQITLTGMDQPSKKSSRHHEETEEDSALHNPYHLLRAATASSV